MSDITVKPGQIVVIDWRGDALPKEANKQRPCVVVEDGELFDPTYPNVIVVPLTDDEDFVVKSLSVEIAPTSENGCPKTCYALGHAIATASKARIVKVTNSHVTDEQLKAIRDRIAESIGIPN
ncbi:MAG TPA: type II toxin-antitoxin system PemK/MazF family toxin [Candidatus Baltobacteraceae bacterium]|nr:type II toxin-antitoxin system PemK/MazF family toxin [Candidatus Baltobacteraceae bacterium]